MISKQRLIKLTQDLIRINSENPPGDESRIAGFVKSHLKKSGLKPKIYEFKEKRLNVLAFLEGRINKTLLVSPHLDTVPAAKGAKHNPFAAKIEKGRIYGRGSTDCKCNLAISLEAIRSICEEKIKPQYNILFVASADEETGSKYGLIPLLEKGIIKADYALVLDSDEFNIVIAQKGLMHFKVKVFGKAAHGAYPERGINAIELSSRIICALKEHRFNYKAHPLLKHPTVNIGKISGGEKVNIVADYCEFEVDLRYLPGMDKNKIIAAVKKIIRTYAKKFKIEFNDIQKPYLIDRNHLLIHSLLEAAGEVKVKPKVKGSEGATVITFFQERDIPAISFGCGSSGCAHTNDEYVKIDNLYRGAKILEGFLKKNFAK
ncbi:MAG: M20 family metallopeptidase [Candidatus Omnitrophota bacterium]|nr:M20 family metallopeptidase [Candidatus Omnitrophota bacterium]